MLNLILGKPTCDAQTELANRIGELMGNDEHVLLLVPDQYTLSAERNIINKLNIPGFMNLEVLSFNRLGWRIMEGAEQKVRLSEQGKSMIMRMVINRCRDQLGVFRSVSSYNGFAKQCMELVDKLNDAQVTAEILDSYVNDEKAKGIAKRKMEDLAIIFKLYNSYIADKFVDNSSFLTDLIKFIPDSPLIKNSHIFIDGFTVFTAQMYSVIGQLLKCSRGVTISLPYSDEEDDSDCYEIQLKVVEKLAEKQVVNIITPPIGEKTEEIMHVADNLYAYSYKKFEEDINNVEACIFQNISTEVEYAAVRIRELVKEGYRFNEISVICNALDTYGAVIERMFKAYNIPYFMDVLRPVANHPVIDAIMSVLDIIMTDFDPESVLLYLKTGLAGLPSAQVDRLEETFGALGIRRWDIKDGLARRKSVEDETRALFEDLRVVVVDPIVKLAQELKGKTTAEGCSLIYDFIIQELMDRIKNFTAEQESAGYVEQARESAQIFNVIVEIFEQMTAIMGDEELDYQQFKSILNEGFESYKTGIIPTTIDQVTVGDITRTKSTQVRASFILGVNEGVLPSIKAVGGLLTDSEITDLKERGIDIGMEASQVESAEKLDILTAFVRPSDKLLISCSAVNTEGKSVGKSSLFTRIEEMFPKLEVKSELDEKIFERFFINEYGLIKYTAHGIRLAADGKNVGFRWKDAYRIINSICSQGARERLSLLVSGVKNRNSAVELDVHRAAIFNEDTTSISRLETFSECAYKHFICYGIRPQIWKGERPEALDTGNVFHKALERFAKSVEEDGIEWRALTEGEITARINRIMAEIIEQFQNGKFDFSAANRAMARKIVRDGAVATRYAVSHIQKGDFVPKKYEMNFGLQKAYSPVELSLGDIGNVYLEGKIDRVDVTRDDKYLRIIDYKSSDNKLDITKIANGIQLQLPIYMEAAQKAFSDTVPAGMFYYTLKDKIIEIKKSGNQSGYEKDTGMTLHGLYINEPEVLDKLEQNMGQKSTVINLSKRSNGAIYENNEMLSRDNFDAVINMAKASAAEAAKRLKSGDTSIHPYKSDKYNYGCKYCEYKGICAFDQRYADNKYRVLEKFTIEGGAKNGMDRQTKGRD